MRRTARMVPFTKLHPVLPYIMETCLCSLLVWEEESYTLEKLQNQTHFSLGHANMENFCFSNCQMGLILAVNPMIPEFLKDAQVSVQTALHS